MQCGNTFINDECSFVNAVTQRWSTYISVNLLPKARFSSFPASQHFQHSSDHQPRDILTSADSTTVSEGKWFTLSVPSTYCLSRSSIIALQKPSADSPPTGLLSTRSLISKSSPRRFPYWNRSTGTSKARSTPLADLAYPRSCPAITIL
jgi:hypothetical protein